MKEKRQGIERTLTALVLTVVGGLFLALGLMTPRISGAGLSGGMVPVIFGAGIFGVLSLYLANTAKEEC